MRHYNFGKDIKNKINMKTITDFMNESLLGDMEKAMSTGENDILIELIFDKDLNKRRQGFEQLLTMIESRRPKRLMATAKMKNSESYFIEFTQQIENEDGEGEGNYISYIQICKRTGLSYRTVCIGSMRRRGGNLVNVYEMKWNDTQPNFNPKWPGTKLYEVPEELNDLFNQIQMEAYNHK